jgi:adenylate cyclase
MANTPPLSEPLQVRVLVDERPVSEGRLTGPLELGRQQTGEPSPYAWLPAAGATPARLVIAPQDERDNVSRRHALLEPLPSGRVRVSNRSKAPLPFPAGPAGALAAGEAGELTPPFALALAGRTVSVGPIDSAEQLGLHSLDGLTIGPSRAGEFSSALRSLPSLGKQQLNELIDWLQTTMGVLQSVVGAADFLDRAAEAVVRIVGLDVGRVLLLDGDCWVVAASYGAGPEDGPPSPPSRHVLARVRERKKTFWESQGLAGDTEPPSLGPLQIVVASPLLDVDGHVVGALYGERHKAPAPRAHAGGKLEAILVELLACGVAAGLARQAQEKAALEARVCFEQFFGPDLARRLVREPGLLEGREAVVTLLDCGVRGFGSLADKLGAARGLLWMNDVMSALSRPMLDEGGIVVDYVADGFLAMWGAPQDQPDQAARVVRAALAARAVLPALDTRWQGALGTPTEIGIGIYTGPARVGNTGSQFRFKYGPLGRAVAVASQVRKLTRMLKCPLLITRSTRQQLGDEFVARRVVAVRLAGADEPIDLYDVEPAGSQRRGQFIAEAEAALEALEAGEFTRAAHKAGSLLLAHSDDGPLLLTLTRAASALMQDGRGFHPAWEPPGNAPF